jgi:sugar phosphate isomerase/epimerase
VTFLTVSTLGAPGASLERVLSWLQTAGVSGLELRLSQKEIVHPAMTARQLAEVAAAISGAGIAVTGIASYVQVAGAANDEMVIGSLASAMNFAAALGAPMVRVFPGAPAHPSTYSEKPRLLEPVEEVTARAVRRLDAVATLAEDLGVYPALETHDSHPQGADIAGILQRVEGPVGAVWDIMHPWRTGESLDETWRWVSPWLGRGAVQVKDANLPADATPVLIGDGTLPVDAFADLLTANGYDGPICLEWEKKWHPAAVDLPVALASTTAWFQRHWQPDPSRRQQRTD